MMRFGGKKVFVPRTTAELNEEVDEDELRGGVRVTDSKRHQQPQPPQAQAPAQAPAPRRVAVQGASTNVVALRLGSLKDSVSVATGDLVVCACGAALAHDSARTDTHWTCDFCFAQCPLTAAPEELPQSAQVDYVLSGPVGATDDAHVVVFVLDTSGSMCVTVPAEGDMRLRPAVGPSAELLAFREGGAAQQLPGERGGEQYVSRLQCVSAAVEAQLLALRAAKPNVRVGLVTFASDVVVIGDASRPPVVITGDKLADAGRLHSAGAEYAAALAPVSQSHAALVQAVHALEEVGGAGRGFVCALSLSTPCAARHHCAGPRPVCCHGHVA